MSPEEDGWRAATLVVVVVVVGVLEAVVKDEPFIKKIISHNHYTEKKKRLSMHKEGWYNGCRVSIEAGDKKLWGND